MPISPLPGLPQTAAKANVGSIAMAVTTLVLYLLARFLGIVAMPDASLVADAVVALVSAGVSAGITWLTVYFTPNKPKDGAALQSHPIATLFAFALVLAVLGGFLFGGSAVGVTRDAPMQMRAAEARAANHYPLTAWSAASFAARSSRPWSGPGSGPIFQIIWTTPMRETLNRAL
jgi:hypothetical protein